jgi:hypothetical protein
LEALESRAEVFDGLEVGVGLKGGLDGFAGLRGKAYAFAAIYATWVCRYLCFTDDVDVRFVPIPVADADLGNGIAAVTVLDSRRRLTAWSAWQGHVQPELKTEKNPRAPSLMVR